MALHNSELLIQALILAFAQFSKRVECIFPLNCFHQTYVLTKPAHRFERITRYHLGLASVGKFLGNCWILREQLIDLKEFF